MISSAFEGVGAFLFLVGLGLVFYASQTEPNPETLQAQGMELRAEWARLPRPAKVGFALMFAAIVTQCVVALIQ